MFYQQDCCASCYIDDICGDVTDLLYTPILTAIEASNKTDPPIATEESYTWTFYRISTIKGTVVIRWYGSSNGYYSETASFERVSP
jgi:hypothetical protein